MQLESLRYTENEGNPQEWVLDGLMLGQRNLIVGKNATGKSRTLQVVYGLANYLVGIQQPSSSADCSFDGKLQHNGKTYQYSFRIEKHQVIAEKLSINEEVVLERGENGIGTIKAEEEGGELRFQPPTSELAAFSRRDALQHSFLEPLFEWASSVRLYHFGRSLGQNNFAMFQQGAPKIDERDENAVVGIFRDGTRDFPGEFVKTLINDMAAIDYHIEKIDIGPPLFIRVTGLPNELSSIYVKEKDLPGFTDQMSMSQGMFRVLSLLIHVNYFQLKKTATCVLVDDIGEGLDFDRSSQLIELLRHKADISRLQIVLSSNDRFIMNKVPLYEWSVLQRKGNHVNVHNYFNSQKAFDEFKYTGLSNFSFLEMDVINALTAEEI